MTTRITSDVQLDYRSSRPSEHEPDPIDNNEPAIVDEVILDLTERKLMGIKKYGGPLKKFNGRKARVDEYQEEMDRLLYMRQDIDERDAERLLIIEALGLITENQPLEWESAKRISDILMVLYEHRK